MTGTLVMHYDEAVKVAEGPEGRRQFRWRRIVAGAIATVVLAGGCGFLATDLRERQVSGTPTADPIEVVTYADERETQAIADQRAADDAFLAALETEVKQSIKEHFEDPANSLYLPIVVTEVVLIKTADNKYEGTATMQAGSNTAREIPIHVTADDRTLMWQTDPGALVPLFR
ncbi:hypothetical protein [Mycobacterium sp. URHB0021]